MLSHDASNELQFKRLHSANMSLLRRKQGMWELQEMGYHTGTGFLVGTPYQTIENVSEDLLFMKQFMPQMIQIAPFWQQNIRHLNGNAVVMRIWYYT